MALGRQTSPSFPLLSLFFFALCCEAIRSPSPSTTPSDVPASDSAVSLTQLFELALPEISVQNKVTVQADTEGPKIASKQLQAVEHKINEFKAVLKKRLDDPNTSKSTRACLTQCQDNFADAIDGVKTSIESIHKQDIHKANVDVSAISTDIDTCNECFIEMTTEDPEIKAFDDWVHGVTGDCLVHLQKPRS